MRIFHYFSICFFILISTFTFTFAKAEIDFEVDDELSEISGSLLFHTNELVDELAGISEQSISFSEEEEADLWLKLLSGLKGNEKIAVAYDLFWQAKNSTAIDSQVLFEKSAEYLSDFWITRNESVKHGLRLFSQFQDIIGNADFDNHPDIPKKAREKIKPYLIPDSHPLKPALDAIFTASRATKNREEFDKAGFITHFVQPRSYILVASHPALPGHLIKANLDNDLRTKRNKPAWEWFVLRCEGAAKIKKIIKDKGLVHCVVPKKYIYPLPANPPQPDGGYMPKITVLLVQDMNLVSKHENLNHWKTKITRGHLRELYTIISRANGSSYRAANLPFTKSGKIAFVDTEYPDRKPDYKSMREYLSHDMLRYWDKLVKSNGHPD